MSREKEDLDRVKKVCEELGEHFDSIQIFATRHEAGEEDGTVNLNWGSGNWFARFGQVKTWCVKHEEFTRLDARKYES